MASTKQPILDGLQPEHLPIDRIVSGGQTGVDRAALDVAIALGIPHGGWCPSGRRAEDGIIPAIYQLRELDSEHYADRSRRNVIDSDGTLVLYRGRLEGGSLLTARFAEEIGKPCHRVRLQRNLSYLACWSWFQQHSIRVVNIAGPRASKDAVVYSAAKQFLYQLFG